MKWAALVLILGIGSLLATDLGNPFRLESHYLYFIYIVGIYLAVAAGASSAQHTTTASIFSLILCLAASGQIAASLAQWAGSVTTISIDNWWSTPGRTGARTGGNISQANNYGTLVIWGYLSWLYLVCKFEVDQKQKVFSRFTLSLVAIYFSFGLVLGQSKTSIMSLTVISVLALSQARQFSSSVRYAWVTFLLGTVTFWYIQPVIANIWLSDELAVEARVFIASDLRLPLWSMFLSATSDSITHLLLGHGWGAIAATHSYVAGSSSNLPDLGNTPFAHTHNIFLDVLVSFGVLGFLLLALLIWKLSRKFFLSRADEKSFFLWAMLIALGLHANLEYPHWYGYFVWPAGFMVGLLIGPAGGVVIQRQVALPALIVSLALVGFTFNQYLDFEKAFANYAIQLAQKGRITDIAHGKSSLLPGLTETLDVAAIPISAQLTLEDSQRLSRAAIFKPSSFNIQRAYYASAFLQDVKGYEFFSRLACRMSGYPFASQIHTVSLTIPVSMTRRKIGSDCNIVVSQK